MIPTRPFVNLDQARSHLWVRLLDHMESEQPRLLSAFLNTGGLEAYLNNQVQAAQKRLVDLKQAPDLLPRERLEVVLGQWESEPENQREKGLSPEAEKKLKEFKDKMQDALEADPSHEIVRPLAELLLTGDLLFEFRRELDRKLMDHLFRPGQTQEEVEEAVRALLWNYPYLLQSEDKENALEAPEDYRGEVLLDSIMANMSNEDH